MRSLEQVVKTLLSSVVLALAIGGCDIGVAPRGKVAATMMQISAFSTALDNYKRDSGRYPSTREGLDALVARPTYNRTTWWRGPYLESFAIPPDLWGNAYVYRCPGIHNTNSFDLYSCGPDGISRSGGADADDVNSWDLSSRNDTEVIAAARARLTAWVPFVLLSIVIVWWSWRNSKSEGNWHGAIALFLASGVITAAITLDLFDRHKKLLGVPLGFIVVFGLVVAGGFAVSGLFRGRLISKAYGTIVIIGIFILMWLVLMPRFSH